MRRLGADRKVLRADLQRRLFVAGAHAARARHPGRLRPAQERDRKTFGARAHGAARHGDDRLAMETVGRLILRLLLVPLGAAVAITVAMLVLGVAHWNE